MTPILSIYLEQKRRYSCFTKILKIQENQMGCHGNSGKKQISTRVLLATFWFSESIGIVLYHHINFISVQILSRFGLFHSSYDYTICSYNISRITISQTNKD